MEITRIGHSCFKIKGKQAIVVTDPYDPKAVGFRFPKTEAKIVTISHNHVHHNNSSEIEGNPFIISGPGEYEIAGVFVRGIATFHDDKKGEERGKNIIYKIEIDGIQIAHLGDLGHKLTDEQLDKLSDVDILLIPVGGTYTLDSSQAAEVVAKIEPKIVIPMHYFDEKINPDTFEKIAKVSDFVAEIGKEPKKLPKLTLTKDKLPSELEVIILE